MPLVIVQNQKYLLELSKGIWIEVWAAGETRELKEYAKLVKGRSPGGGDIIENVCIGREPVYRMMSGSRDAYWATQEQIVPMEAFTLP